ncbi:MAG: RES domain-containing protein [Frankiaceae bacterium]
MLVYRVFPHLETAAVGEPGHPLYEHRPQRYGRIDHPDYYVWYVSRSPEAAAGEAFGNLAVWDSSMFEFPQVPGSRRALGVFELPDDLRVLDLDDPAALLERRLRPTQVVVRNLAVTQRWGHEIWDERDPHDARRRRWQAVQWWSYHHPSWPILASWARPEFVRAESLDLTHPAVVDAARALHRLLP